MSLALDSWRGCASGWRWRATMQSIDGQGKCSTCDLRVAQVCRAEPGQIVDPRGDCPAWRPRERLQSTRCEEHAHLNRAIEILLRAYPEIWYNQAHEVAKVLQATKLRSPDWPHLADLIYSLRKWVPKGQRRGFKSECNKAGANTKGKGW